MPDPKARWGYRRVAWTGEHECPPVYRKRLEELLPSEVALELCRLINIWSMDLHLGKEAPTPAGRRRALNELAEALERARDLMMALDDDSRMDLINEMIDRDANPKAYFELRTALWSSDVWGFARMAADGIQTQRGAPKSRRHDFSVRVVRTLMAAGIEVTPIWGEHTALVLKNALDAVGLSPSEEPQLEEGANLKGGLLEDTEGCPAAEWAPVWRLLRDAIREAQLP